MKRIVMFTAGISAVVIALIFLSGVSFSFFTDKTSADNTFTCSSGIKGHISETKWGDIDKKITKKYIPGQNFEKNPVVTIEKDSGTDAYVAIKAECFFDDSKTVIPLDTMLQNYISIDDFNTGTNEDEWSRYNDTDLYIYNSVVKKGEDTKALFENVKIKNDIYEKYKEEYNTDEVPDFHIVLTGYAVSATDTQNGELPEKYYIDELAGLAF